MKVLAGIRLGLWAIVLGLCIVIGGLYLTVSQTLLQPRELQSWTTEANLGKTIREKVITPRVAAALENTQPEEFSLVTRDMITKSLDQALPDDTLNARLTPATTALSDWLDKKTSDITYSIPSKDLRESFFDHLGANLDQKIASLPKCTFNSTYDDIQHAKCFYSEGITSQVKVAVLEAAEKGSREMLGDTISSDSVPLVPTTGPSANIPDSLNLLGAAALVAGAILAIGSLWLLIAKRSLGVITLGAAALIGGGGLLATWQILQQRIGGVAIDPLYQPLVTTAIDAMTKKGNGYALLSILTGGLLIIIGLGLFTFFRRRNEKSSIHFS